MSSSPKAFIKVVLKCLVASTCYRLKYYHVFVFSAHVDSCPITCVKYVSSHEICTTNTMGQLRIWDLRAPGDRPARVIVSCDNLTALRSVDRHPSQSHVIATGSSDGSVTLHDVRKDNGVVTKLQVHSEDGKKN